jgi:DNA repair protein RecO (recombination protein O)
MIVKTEAIVLKKMRYGDSSLIATLYTKDRGKVKLIAKGALRPKSRFAATLMPLQHLNVQYYEKKGGLSVVSDAEMASVSHELSHSYEHLSVGLSLLESVDLKEEDDGPEPRLFAMLLRSIELLGELPHNPGNVFLLFQYHFATLQGYKIDLKNVPPADEELDVYNHLLAFYHEEGRAISRGKASGLSAFTFHIDSFYILRKLVASGFEECVQVSIDTDAFDELTRFFASYYSYHLERKVEYRSLALLRG